MHIRFDVEDTGIGIPLERQEEIFELFAQGDMTTSRKYGGTGLGLTITRQLARLLNGELALTSEPGKGSTFSLSIPADFYMEGQTFLSQRSAAPTPPSKKETAKPETFAGNVLIAEDIPANQILMKRMLQKRGLTVTVVSDGRQALEKALAQNFDLIFLDMMMPKLTGYEVARILNSKGGKTPIVALTARAMKDDREKCTQAGCDDYLTKPLDQKKMLNILKKISRRPQPKLNSY